ncbi:phosphatidylserine/phosphatidylglycerophosphate/cardiolipin synthase family protein (plasmid) [Rhodococcus pyridinivorans]|uniref:phosphatidylserine/phosphatidylglycerophosphate/ cardiolipin synthase family protein n=1 Tax=Rhodococcus pyridinivorans TaxID=103816 RepID=UPI0020C5C691|nr:phosphatidylserine/phosphatidylglycerophosphate/cardiolipin synthase family protein [Rhodococcus pyridinivorans]UTM39889.1 phosphatidylserine/phosphatidylglycerophosphate/cardiolipin synthase family protein [Rhodococcus pyridinivorans]
MDTVLHAPHPWPAITAALRGRGPRRVAIAYLDHTAPELLPLRTGDQLIVNAARPAVRAHATSPTALAHFLEAGVQVLSTANLHTGLIVTAEKVIVGPASASHASTVADETALITDDPDAIAAAHAFLDRLADTVVVDEVFLDSATAIWQIGRVVPLAGIGSRARLEHDFLPTPVRRMFLRHLGDYTPTEDNETSSTSPAPGRGGPDPRYRTEWVREDSPGRDRRTRLEPGDVVIRISDDNTRLDPPAVVDTGPHRIPHTHHSLVYRLRTRADLDPIPIPDAARLLADRGHSNPRLHRDHRIISASLRAAVLALWKL